MAFLPRLGRAARLLNATRGLAAAPLGGARPQLSYLRASSSAAGQDYWGTVRPVNDEGPSGGLKEFSVVYTDRALNSMSTPFRQVMIDLHQMLCEVYNASTAVIIPGSGTYGMEAAVCQYAKDQDVLVIRNGYFSYRWTDIFEQTGIPRSATVMKARAVDNEPEPAFAPPPIEEVVARIAELKPGVVFAPHVETSVGIMLPDDYIKQVSDAVHAYGGIFVLDCIASGTVWVDMKKTGCDVIISAPQKGWTGPACVALMMLSQHAKDKLETTTSTSMIVNLKKWNEVMEAYLKGGFMYYTTLPSDGLRQFRDVALETKAYGNGWEKVKTDFLKLGDDVRTMMASKGLKSVAAEGFRAPGVVVSYVSDNTMFARFREKGMQIAGGVPFMIDEPKGLNTFRIGLFGLDKVVHSGVTVSTLEKTLDQVLEEHKAEAQAA